jgi:hypothetical protein
MDTADSSSAAIPSGNDIKDRDRNEKIEKAVKKYISNLTNELGKSKFTTSLERDCSPPA